jgi:hypothetical protein
MARTFDEIIRDCRARQAKLERSTVHGDEYKSSGPGTRRAGNTKQSVKVQPRGK